MCIRDSYCVFASCSVCWVLVVDFVLEFCCLCSMVHTTYCSKSLEVKLSVIYHQLLSLQWCRGIICQHLKLRLPSYFASACLQRLAMPRTTSSGFVFVTFSCWSTNDWVLLANRNNGIAYLTGYVSFCDVGVLRLNVWTRWAGFSCEGYHRQRTATSLLDKYLDLPWGMETSAGSGVLDINIFLTGCYFFSFSNSVWVFSQGTEMVQVTLLRRTLASSPKSKCASCLQCFDTVGWAAGRASVKNMGGWWRWALVSLDGVTPSQMVSLSLSVNLPLHHKVQKFFSGTGSPGWWGIKRLWWWWFGFLATVGYLSYCWELVIINSALLLGLQACILDACPNAG